jgi:TrmH family RNA methyltransferase
MFKSLRLLAHSGRERRKQGRTILDGVHLAETYLARVGVPSMLAVSESGLGRSEIRRFVEYCAAPEAMVFSDPLFAELSPVDTPTGLLAAIAIPPPPVVRPIKGSAVVLDRVQDAGNVGSVLRSAAAVAVTSVLLTEGCANVWSPKVLRAAMGAHFSLVLMENANVRQLLEAYSGRIIATRPNAGEEVFATNLQGPVTWFFGSEGAGLSPELATLATETVRIPMAAATESLNVAAAAAVCLFEQLRQRRSG